MSRRPSSIPDALCILFSDPKFPGGATHSERHTPSDHAAKRYDTVSVAPYTRPTSLLRPCGNIPTGSKKEGAHPVRPPYNRSGGRYYMTMAPNRLRSRNTAATVRMEYSSGNAARINVLPMTLWPFPIAAIPLAQICP